jgi:hypothetical protein
MRHLRVTLWLTAIRKIKDADRAQMLRRCVQRRMGWRDPLTILCYDHSFTEREDEEVFAETFQRETERQVEVCTAVAKVTIPTQPQEPVPVPHQSAAQLQALADLEFWKDEP